MSINVIYHESINDLNGINLNDYVIDITSFELSKNQYNRIMLPHPVIQFDSDITEIVSLEVGKYISISINDRLLRCYIDEILYKDEKKIYTVNCFDIIQKLIDVNTDTIEDSYWSGYDVDMELFNKADYVFSDQFNIPYLTVFYCIRVMLNILGVEQNKILFANPSADSRYLGSQYELDFFDWFVVDPIRYKRLVFDIEIFKRYGKPEGSTFDNSIGNEKGTCLDFLIDILSVINYGYSYIGENVVFYPGEPGIINNDNILNINNAKLTTTPGYIVNIEYSASSTWDSVSSFDGQYPDDEDVKEFKQIRFNCHFYLKFLRKNRDAETYSIIPFGSSGLVDNIAAQIANYLYDITRNNLVLSYDIDGVLYPLPNNLAFKSWKINLKNRTVTAEKYSLEV